MIRLTARAGSRVWFTGDTHFGHEGVIRMTGRPFATVVEMDDALVHAWNGVVGPYDEVWHLGDFVLGTSSERCREIFDHLHGRKNLVVGNHDRARTLALPWASRHDLVRVRVDETEFVLCHYAMRAWPGLFRGARHLYGHTHATLPGTTRSCDVGVDAWNYRPVDAEEIIERMGGTDAQPEEIAAAEARHGGGR